MFNNKIFKASLSWIVAFTLLATTLLPPVAPSAKASALPSPLKQGQKAAELIYKDSSFSETAPIAEAEAVFRGSESEAQRQAALLEQQLLLDKETFSNLNHTERETLVNLYGGGEEAFAALEIAGLGLSASVGYALTMSRFSITVGDALHGAELHGSIDNLAMELGRLHDFADEYALSPEDEQSARQFVLTGLPYADAVRGYGALKVMQQGAASIRCPETASMISQGKTSLDAAEAARVAEADEKQTPLEDLSSRLAIKPEIIERHLRDERISTKVFEQQIDKKLYEIMGIDDDPVMAMAAAPGQKVQAGSLISEPFSYNVSEYETVNLNSGEYSYEETDLVLPGKNGLDLVMKRRYSLDDANVTYPSMWVNPNTLNTNVYTLRYAFYRQAASGDYNCYESQRLDRNDLTLNWTATPTSLSFYSYNVSLPASEKDTCAYFLRNESVTLFMMYYKSNGVGFLVLAKPEVVINESALFNCAKTDEFLNNHNLNLYGLGQGWSYAFTTIEEAAIAINDNIVTKKVLRLADGRRYEVEFGNSQNPSNLKGYKLSDLTLLNSADGYPGATYTLRYADGKKEHFDDRGRLLAIRDRYDNRITFQYTLVGRVVKTMTITDTLGRVVTLSTPDGSSVPTGDGRIDTRVLTAPDGVVKTFEIETTTDLSVSVDYTRLRKATDRNGDETQYSTIRNTTTFNAFSPYPLSTDSYQPVMNLSSVTYPSGLRLEYTTNVTFNTHRYLDGFGYEKYFRLSNRRLAYPGGPYGYDENVLSERYTYEGSYSGYNSPSLFMNQYNFSVVHTKNYTYQLPYNYFSLPTETTLHSFNQTQQKQSEETRHAVPEIYKELNVDNVSAQHYMNLSGSKTFTYDSYGLPQTITENLYNYMAGGTTALQRITRYVRDAKGNITSYTDPLNNTTTYTYNAAYNQLTSVSYAKDASTTVTKQYMLTNDNKGVATEQTLENNVVKEKTEYIYDVYGNVTRARRYKDNMVGYQDTLYDYADNQNRAAFNGAYLTRKSVAGVADSGGAAVTTPGQTGGTVAELYFYDTMGRLQKSVDPNGGETLYQYNNVGDIARVTNPDNSFSAYSYDYSANRMTVTDELGNRLQYQYHYTGALASVEDLESGEYLSSYTYDGGLPGGGMRLREESNQNSSGAWQRTVYSYDHKGRTTGQKTYGQTGALLYAETYAYSDVYNSSTQRMTQTVAGGTNAPAIVTHSYTDKMGRQIRRGAVTDGVEHSKTYTYDNLGNLLSAKSARANAENFPESSTGRWEYDFQNRPVREYNVFGAMAETSYDALGNKVSYTDFAGSVSYFTYDALGRLLRSETPFEQSGGTVYYSKRLYDYDAAGNLLRERISNHGSGQAESFRRTDYGYDSRSRLTLVTDFEGSSPAGYTAYQYDLAGNQTAVFTGLTSPVPGSGSACTAMEYDRQGRVTRLTDALGQSETYTYDANGNQTGKTDRNGQTTTTVYDGLGRPLSVTVRDAENNVTGRSQYAYAATGRLLSESNDHVTVSYTYDSQGRVLTETESGGVVRQYTYDAAGNRKTFKLQVNGALVTNSAYVYDKADRLQNVHENNMLRATYGYDVKGNRASLTYGSGQTTAYTYNLANALVSLTNKLGAQTQSSYTYLYYLDGNQRQKTAHNGAVTAYLYDGQGRLRGESVSGGLALIYDYDAAGNRAAMTASGSQSWQETYQYDLNNRLLQSAKTEGGVTEITGYRYDANGNELSRMRETLTPQGGAGESLALEEGTGEDGGEGYRLNQYNGFNQLTSVNIDGEITAYAYRPDGLRHTKTAGGHTLRHVWDGGSLAAELTDGAVSARYIRGINLISRENTSGTQYYAYNGHGDVVQLSNSAGTVIKTYDYDAFGVEKNPVATDANPFRYCGEYLDFETNTYYLRARYYDPGIGRFTSEDTHWNPVNRVYGDNPVKYAYAPNITVIMQSNNLYVYGINNPLFWIDPSGKAVTEWDRAMLSEKHIEILEEYTRKWDTASDEMKERYRNDAERMRALSRGADEYTDASGITRSKVTHGELKVQTNILNLAEGVDMHFRAVYSFDTNNEIVLAGASRQRVWISSLIIQLNKRIF